MDQEINFGLPELKPISKKLAASSLETLYAAPKITPSIENAIRHKDDFTSINVTYCTKVCQLQKRCPSAVRLVHNHADIVIIQDHKAVDQGYDTGDKRERQHQSVIRYLAEKYFQPRGLSYTVLNAVKCELPKGKEPSLTVLKKCAPYILEEIKAIKPSVIICLGGVASKIIGQNRSVYTCRGEVHNNVVLTLHPEVCFMIRQNSSGAMWGSDYLEVIDRDFAKAAKLASGELVIPPLETALEEAEKRIHICESIEEVEECMDRLWGFEPNKLVSYDLETTSLDPWADNAKILTAQFGYTNPERGQIEAFVVTLWHRDWDKYDPKEAWSLIAQWLSEPACLKIGHNLKFDINYTYATTGVRVEGAVFDTMLMLHSMNSGIQGNYGLKRAVWDFLPDTGLGGYEDQLPKLTKPKAVDESEEGGDGEEGEEDEQKFENKIVGH